MAISIEMASEPHEVANRGYSISPGPETVASFASNGGPSLSNHKAFQSKEGGYRSVYWASASLRYVLNLTNRYNFKGNMNSVIRQ